MFAENQDWTLDSNVLGELLFISLQVLDSSKKPSVSTQYRENTPGPAM